MTQNGHIYVAIMAGGIGSRFWPSSTAENPKQFLDILGTGKSLLRITFERYLKLVPPEKIFFVTHVNYQKKILELIPEIKESQIICEPSRNNTAPGIAYVAFKINELDPNAELIIAPSDHVILKEDEFIKLSKMALEYCRENDALLTLGILPTRPDTGYGYIKFEGDKNYISVQKVLEFKEKPDLQTALNYLDKGNYLWNSGMFIWRTKVILNAFKEFAPEIYQILEKGKGLYNTERENEFILENFPKTPSISVDYAIMEHAQNIFTIPADISWSDLGTWNALHAFLPKDKNENVLLNSGFLIEESSNNLIKSNKEKIIIAKGLNDFIVIDEDDILLIYPKNKEQEVKAIRERVLKQFNK